LSSSPVVTARLHPFPAKLTLDQADEVRRLRARGVPLAELAEKFGIARSSVSAIVHFKVHETPGTLRVALPEFERALLAEVAEDEEVSVEQLAADLLIEMLLSRAW
jgi:transcriptional regulator with XRE-family HTH domain